jgi:hypothetical protein
MPLVAALTPAPEFFALSFIGDPPLLRAIASRGSRADPPSHDRSPTRAGTSRGLESASAPSLAGNRCWYGRQSCRDRPCAGSVQLCPSPVESRSKNNFLQPQDCLPGGCGGALVLSSGQDHRCVSLARANERRRQIRELPLIAIQEGTRCHGGTVSSLSADALVQRNHELLVTDGSGIGDPRGAGGRAGVEQGATPPSQPRRLEPRLISDRRHFSRTDASPFRCSRWLTERNRAASPPVGTAHGQGAIATAVEGRRAILAPRSEGRSVSDGRLPR